MLMVKTMLKRSDINGLGLFAMEDIAAGRTVWKFDGSFDRYFSVAELKLLPEVALITLLHYGYFSRRTGQFILDADDGRFMNHSYTPNTKLVTNEGGEDLIVAAHIIPSGTEITTSYLEHADIQMEEREFPHFQSFRQSIANASL